MPEENYEITCDDSNNSQEDIDANRLNCDVTFHPGHGAPLHTHKMGRAGAAIEGAMHGETLSICARIYANKCLSTLRSVEKELVGVLWRSGHLVKPQPTNDVTGRMGDKVTYPSYVKARAAHKDIDMTYDNFGYPTEEMRAITDGLVEQYPFGTSIPLIELPLTTVTAEKVLSMGFTETGYFIDTDDKTMETSLDFAQFDELKRCMGALRDAYNRQKLKRLK